MANPLRPHVCCSEVLLGVIVLFAMRQACQALVALPPPEGLLWRDPGVPSLLVTYSTSTDFFFSGHTAIAVLAAIEVARLDRLWLTIAVAAVVVLEALTVLALRAHYTMDVVAAVFAAFAVAHFSSRVAPAVDRLLSGRRSERIPCEISSC